MAITPQFDIQATICHTVIKIISDFLMAARVLIILSVKGNRFFVFTIIQHINRALANKQDLMLMTEPVKQITL
jgi:hypothetical protein